MIVCHCHAKTDGHVREAARRGAHTCEQVARLCGAGDDCGGCRPHIEFLLQGVRADQGAGARPPAAAAS